MVEIGDILVLVCASGRAVRLGGPILSGGVKIFRWGVSPSKKAQGTAIVYMSFTYTLVYLNQQHLHLPPASPLPPV